MQTIRSSYNHGCEHLKKSGWSENLEMMSSAPVKVLLNGVILDV